MQQNFNSPSQQAVERAKKILEQCPLYLDTETTGLSPKDEIVEIAIIDSEAKIIFDSLVRPSQKIPDEVVRIHGIRDEHVRTASFWPMIWQQIRPFLDGKVVASYNSDFDIRLMKQSHQKYNLNWVPTFSIIDIMTLFSQYRNIWNPVHHSFRLFKLDDAREFFHISLPNTHRAFDDALLARAVLLHISGLEI
jgi:DNA polymerase III subunit epsilon